MKKTTKTILQSFIIVPLIATTLSMNTVAVAINQAVTRATAADISSEEVAAQAARAEKAAKIDAYFAQYDLPLAGHGMQMVLAAEKNELDWRLIPAIAMRESTGGKFICPKSFNPYGWGSCKIHFESFDDATATVAANLGGNVEKTSKYYAGKDIKGILSAYNNVIPTYTAEILSIMNKIEKTEA